MEMTPHNQEIQEERNGQREQQQQPDYIDTHSDLDPVLNEEIEAQPDDLQQQRLEFNPEGKADELRRQQERERKSYVIAGSLLSYISEEIREIHSPFFPLIYKVPVSVRGVNPECYTPRLVSLGPIHHDSPSLKPMEDLKYRYFQDFRRRTEGTHLDIVKYASLITDMESNIRGQYNEEIKLSSEDFCEMILLDSVFIVELLLKKKGKEVIFENRWWFRDLLHDILLIENQIPFFVPCMIFEGYDHFDLVSMLNSFSDLVTAFTKDVNHKNVSVSIASSSTSTKGAMHFIDYLRRAYLNEDNSAFVTFSMPPEDNSEDNSDDASHRLVFMPLEDNSAKKDFQQPLPMEQDFQQPLPKKKKYKYDVATASRLLEYGVRFEKGKTTSLVDISFDSDKGILTIPQVQVNEWSENLFRNIVAYEQCNLSIIEKKVSDYLIFMDGLIDTAEDVKILIDAKIIQDDLQDPEKISHMFNNLHKEAITEGRDYLFAEQSHELSEYRRNFLHRLMAKWYNWMLILKRDYFNTPWSTLAFITAAMLLGLTIIQTVCSIYPGIQIK